MTALALLRHAISISLETGVVVVVIPVWIARRYHTTIAAPSDITETAGIVVGVVLLAIGLTLFITSLRRFAVDGRGTLAPWDPPGRLVVRGPYRYVRNPMISGVIFLLAAEAAILRSREHAVWTITFLVINMIYIPLLEEPLLAMRFGADYDEYRRNVRRFLPRLSPWNRSERPPASARG